MDADIKPQGPLDHTQSDFFKQSILLDIRKDGRQRCRYRSIQVELGCIAQVLGSAKVTWEGTRVLAGVSLEFHQPEKDRPSAGIVKVSVDCSMIASGGREASKKAEKRGEDLAKKIEALYRGGQGAHLGCLDQDNNLSIVECQSVWLINIDCIVLSDDGNLLDALSLVARAALSNTQMPKCDILDNNEVGSSGPEVLVNDNPNEYWRLNCSNVPVYVSVTPVDYDWVVDLDAEEEALTKSKLSFGICANGTIKVVSTEGSKGVDSKALPDIYEAACTAGRNMLLSLDKLKVQDTHYFYLNF